MIRRRGYSLIDMLIAVSLLGVFSLMAFRLMRATVHLTAQTLVADGNSARFDGAIHSLRADVANSSSIEMPQPTLLRIHGPGNQTIEWTNQDNSLSRSTSVDKHKWTVGQPINLKLDGAIVLVWANPSDQIAMAPVRAGDRR